MICPVNNLKVLSNLTPVEVPHFTSASVRHKNNLNDSFKKKHTAKSEMQSFFGSVKKDVGKSVATVRDASKTGFNFTRELFSSMTDDLYGIAKEKVGRMANTLDKIV